jgi:hypothetical protein
MAKVKTWKYGQGAILLGNGATPTEVFEALCGFEEQTVTLNIEENTETIWDCDAPDDTAWGETTITSKQLRVQFTGLLDTDTMQTMQDWWMDGGVKNARWFRDLSAANGGGYLAAPAELVAWEETGSRNGKWRCSGTIAFNGQPTFTAAT